VSCLLALLLLQLRQLLLLLLHTRIAVTSSRLEPPIYGVATHESSSSRLCRETQCPARGSSVSIRQHTSAYVSICSICQHTSAYAENSSVLHAAPPVSMRLLQSSYVSIRHHTSAYAAHVSIRQHMTSTYAAYVSIRQHTSAYAEMVSVFVLLY
jgi:hypothetical protein